MLLVLDRSVFILPVAVSLRTERNTRVGSSSDASQSVADIPNADVSDETCTFVLGIPAGTSVRGNCQPTRQERQCII